MRKIFVGLTSIRGDYSDAAEQQQAQRLLIINLAWILLLALTVVPVIYWMLDEQRLDAVPLFIPVSLVLAVLTYQSIQRGRFSQARAIFVLNVLIAALLATFPDYRLDTPYIMALTLPITVAGVLLSRSGLFFLALVLIVVVVVGGLIQFSSDMAPTPLGDIGESIRTTVTLAIGVIVLHTVMLWIFRSGIEDSAQRHRQLSHLLEHTSVISQTLSWLATDEDQLIPVVEQIRDALGLYHVQVFLTDSTSGMAVLRASTRSADRRLLEEDSLLMPDENSPINSALRHTEPILITDSAPENQRTGFLPATHSEMLVPLRVGNLVPIGVLDLHSTSHDAFSDAVPHVAATLGSQMAAALHSLHQMRDLRAGYEERDKLITHLDAARRDLERTNRQIASATWGSYLDEQQDAVQGLDWESGTVLPPRLESPVIEKTISEGEPYLDHIDDTAILSVPIRLRGQTLGAVEFRRASSTGWSSSAQEMAQAVAERLALSLENARLFEQTQSAAHREQLVSRITSQLQATNDLQTLLTLAAARFQEALGATYTQVRLGLPVDSAEDPAQE